MAIEVGAVCGGVPNVEVMADVSGLVMRAALGAVGIDARVEENPDAWTVAWVDEVSALVIAVEPGRHEFDDAWYLSVQPGQRGMDVSVLFAVVVVASAALIAGGVVFDEIGLLGGGRLDPGMLLDRILDSGGAGVDAVLEAVRGVSSDDLDLDSGRLSFFMAAVAKG